MIASILTELHALKLRNVADGRAAVLAYHGVVPEIVDSRLERNFHAAEVFKTHASQLKRFRVLPLGELVDVLERGERRDRGAMIAITLDDGYANNMDVAALLSDARLPWTLFLSTGAVDAETTIWTAELSLLLLHGQAKELTVLGSCWPLDVRGKREGAFQAIRVGMKQQPAAERLATMETIRAQFPTGESNRLLDEFPTFRSLTWAEINQLSSAGVEIGSHGIAHELHHAGQSELLRRWEMESSRLRIEQQTGRLCRYFAYPNGVTNERSSTECREAGYHLGFTTRPGFLALDTDRWQLPRFSPGNKPAALVDSLRVRLSKAAE